MIGSPPGCIQVPSCFQTEKPAGARDRGRNLVVAMVLQLLVRLVLSSVTFLWAVLELLEPVIFLHVCLFEWFWKFGWTFLDS